MKNILSKYVFFLIAFVFQGQLLISSVTEITGKVSGHEGVPIFLMTYSDLYTRTLEQKAVSIIDEKGNFHLSAEISEIEYACIRFDHLNAFLYLQPGKKYDIDILPLPEGQNVSINNRTQVLYTFSSLDDDDINKMIIGFNTDHDQFYQENYDLLKTMAAPPGSHFKRSLKGDSVQLKPSHKARSQQQVLSEKILEFERSMDEKYAKINDPFFQVHYKMAIADMHYQLKGDEKILYDTYLKKGSFHPKIPEFINFTRNYYDKYFASYMFKWGDKTLVGHLDAGATNEIKALLKKDDFIANDEMLEYVICHAIYETKNSKHLKKEGMFKVLDDVAEYGSSKANKDFAIAVKRKMTKTRTGYPAYGFELPNSQGELQKLSDLKGKHLLINFWSDQCMSCKKEMSLLPSLYDKYKKHISFTSIGLALKDEALIKFLSKNKNYKWNFLDGTKDASLNEEFEIYSLPQFVLLDEKGNFIEAFAKKPSEGIEEKLFSIYQKKELENKNKRKVGRK